MTYVHEDIREFVVRRPWLTAWLVTTDEYVGLRDRTLTLSIERAFYLRAFADGWKAAKS